MFLHDQQVVAVLLQEGCALIPLDGHPTGGRVVQALALHAPQARSRLRVGAFNGLQHLADLEPSDRLRLNRQLLIGHGALHTSVEEPGDVQEALLAQAGRALLVRHMVKQALGLTIGELHVGQLLEPAREGFSGDEVGATCDIIEDLLGGLALLDPALVQRRHTQGQLLVELRECLRFRQLQTAFCGGRDSLRAALGAFLTRGHAADVPAPEALELFDNRGVSLGLGDLLDHTL
mmetsp:Transcript_54315/g.157013  ORF Transcript_54315/g.157013 Transcript_54315/m.157013 type:complete len:234 (+) Transcript_54315:455-1156(+)